MLLSLFTTMSAIAASLLVIVAFVCAFFNLPHESGVAILFVVALVFFTLGANADDTHGIWKVRRRRNREVGTGREGVGLKPQ
jgi:hypothetical protein